MGLDSFLCPHILPLPQYQIITTARHLPWESNVFIHVEGDDVLEGELTGLMELDKVSVNTHRGRPGGKSKNERLGGRGSKLLNTLLDVLGCKTTHKDQC